MTASSKDNSFSATPQSLKFSLENTDPKKRARGSPALSSSLNLSHDEKILDSSTATQLFPLTNSKPVCINETDLDPFNILNKVLGGDDQIAQKPE